MPAGFALAVALALTLVWFLLGALSLAAPRNTRFIARILFPVGALVGVGSHPYDSPSFLGRLFKDFTTTDAGLAMR